MPIFSNNRPAAAKSLRTSMGGKNKSHGIKAKTKLVSGFSCPDGKKPDCGGLDIDVLRSTGIEKYCSCV